VIRSILQVKQKHADFSILVSSSEVPILGEVNTIPLIAAHISNTMENDSRLDIREMDLHFPPPSPDPIPLPSMDPQMLINYQKSGVSPWSFWVLFQRSCVLSISHPS